MGSIRLKRARLFALGVLAIGGLIAALAVACGGGETQIEIQTVIVEKQLPGQTITEKVVETVVVEKEVTRTEKVVETVLVEKEVTRIEKVIETVVVEREVEGKTVMVVETVVVERPVTRIETVVETVIVEKPVTVVEKVVQVQTVVVAPTPVPPADAGANTGRRPTRYVPLRYREHYSTALCPGPWRCGARTGLRFMGHGRISDLCRPR